MPPKRSRVNPEVHRPSGDESGSDASLSRRLKEVVAEHEQLQATRTSSRQRPESTRYREDTYQTPPKQR
jgi:hypothetical protein